MISFQLDARTIAFESNSLCSKWESFSQLAEKKLIKVTKAGSDENLTTEFIELLKMEIPDVAIRFAISVSAVGASLKLDLMSLQVIHVGNSMPRARRQVI